MSELKQRRQFYNFFLYILQILFVSNKSEERRVCFSQFPKQNWLDLKNDIGQQLLTNDCPIAILCIVM